MPSNISSPGDSHGAEQALPPAGPAWAGSLMGVSVASTLCHLHRALQETVLDLLSYFFLVAASCIFCILCVGFARYRNPRFRQEFMAPWGMAVMGFLALGSAWTTVTGNWLFQEVSWLIATPIGLVVGGNQLRRFHGEPQFLWGLALVTPMVAATSGGQLAHSGFIPEPLSQIHWGIAAVCFVFSLVTGVPLFCYLYLQLARARMHIPQTFAGTNWIPLGIIGQSTAAAAVLTADTSAAGAGKFYGTCVLLLGIAPAIYAAMKYWSATLNWPAYTPGWWGATFPVGTLCLGTHTLATATGTAWLDNLSIGLLMVLIAHIGVAVAGAAWTISAPGK